ncbi:MAG: N-acetyl-gamma-glutamyl-phosphate reductase [Muribaculaceae bacterium]|nr:N-acetyl-gamma-glutamyl-phosphate reductase [Muribaculaceae bacterium]MDE7093051.1 N-acetyl-gamma-glutamyl-phosphate reductase [Muribaculaceae bacterium]
MIKAGIIGGAGYTAGELLRLLFNHPDVEVVSVMSTSLAGSRLDEVHKGLVGETDMKFDSELDLNAIDVLFCCTPHGASKTYIEAHPEISPELRIIDLAADYRLDDGTHDFVYGLPELNRKATVRGAKHIANPGCFATAIQLALLPLAKHQLLPDNVNVNAITGSTGAGVKPGATTHYSWRNDNVSVYKPFTHQHLAEINQTLKRLQPTFSGDIDFIPMRGPFSRGIFASITLKCDTPIEELLRIYRDTYDDHSFTFVSESPIDLKDVVNTNKCLIHLDRHGKDKLLVTVAIDNLLKGATGTAVHNMNLLFGLSEKTGLNLKASAF